MIRAALVGISGYGRWHLLMAMEQALLGRITLVGAVVINWREQPGVCRRLARQGIPIYDSFEQMMAVLAGRVDLILLPTGIHWHAPMAIAALQAGAHVLVEKPLAATLVDADAIMAAETASGRLVAVGFQDLYVPATHDIKQRVLRGDLGTLRRVTVRGQWPRSAAYFSRNGWAGRLRVEGAWVLDSPVGNAYAHFLMLGLFWAGASSETAAEVIELEAELYRAGPIESFDTGCLRARTADGVEILFHGTHAGADDFAPEIRLIGDDGVITWVYERSYTISRRGHRDEVLAVPDQLDTRLSVLDAVLERLEGGARFVVKPALARVHTRLLNALHEYFPIHTVAPLYVERLPGNGGSWHRIRGLDLTMDAAVAGNALFSEIGAKWAVSSGPPCCLRDYERFGGCRTS